MVKQLPLILILLSGRVLCQPGKPYDHARGKWYIQGGAGFSVNFSQTVLERSANDPQFRGVARNLVKPAWHVGTRFEKGGLFFRLNVKRVVIGNYLSVIGTTDSTQEHFNVFASVSKDNFIASLAAGPVIKAGSFEFRPAGGIDYFFLPQLNSYVQGRVGLLATETVIFNIVSLSQDPYALLFHSSMDAGYTFRKGKKFAFELGYGISVALGYKDLYLTRIEVIKGNHARYYLVKNKGTYLLQELHLSFSPGKRPGSRSVSNNSTY